MQEKFLTFRSAHNFPDKEKRVLLTVSGGIDSVVMAHLYHKAGYSCVVAHCNFQLRGGASDQDEQFVEKLAAHYQFHFHSMKFDIANFAKDNSVSIQEAARKLRYEWFSEICETSGCEAIATAHHANDVAETLIFNLVRGAGFAGMHGIPVKNGKIIRPILFAEKNEIEQYAKINKLQWREDASNFNDDYTRNKIRHHIIPLLKEINPKAINNMNKHAASVKNFELLTSDYISGIEKELLQEKWGGVLKTISLKKLFSYPVPEFLLFLLIGKYGFNETVCNAIFSSNRTGAEFLAPGFRLVLDRDELVLFNLNSIHDANIYLIDQFTHSLKLMPGIFDMKKVVWSSADAVQVPDDFRNKETVYLDASKLKLPLSIRRWQDGDSFHPLGMKGSKLISDFLTDEKLPVAEKELVYLLLSENEIVWVLGQRLDEKYRITSSTLEAWKCTYLIN